MEEFEEQFDLNDVFQILRGMYEDQLIAKAELGILDAPPDDPFPMPNTCHPIYEKRADWVRRFGPTRKGQTVVVPKPVKVSRIEPHELYPMAAITPNRVLLHCRRYIAPMPFVGDPVVEQYFYHWRAWVDDNGRHIASDSTIERRELY